MLHRLTRWIRRGLAFALSLGLTSSTLAAEPTLHYPAARRDDVVDTIHGVKIADPYRWLEDASKPDVQQWMRDEDKLTRDVLAQQPSRAKLQSRLKELLYVDALLPPTKHGQRYFYERRRHDREKMILYVRDGAEGTERVLIDPNTLTKDGTTSLGMWGASNDGKLLGYVLHPNNSDNGVLHVMDVASGKDLPDLIEGTDYSGISWTPNGDGFYYMWLPPRTGKPSDSDRFAAAEARFHKLGSDPKRDVRVHEPAGDSRVFVGANLSKDGHWLIYYVAHGESRTDIFFRDQRKPNDTWHPLTSGLDAAYNVAVDRDQFFVHTNEGAPRYRVFRVDPAHPERAHWHEIVAERKDVVIEGAGIMGHQLVLTTLHNASSGVEQRAVGDGKLTRTLQLPGLGSIVAVSGDEDDDDAFFGFTSFTTPLQVLRTSIKNGGVSTWAEVKVPADLSPYIVEQVWFPSKDGTQISMFVIRRKDQPRDGSTPYILNGYGGFNISITAEFHPEIIAWLEAGGGYAVANLRGGGEYGEEWHRAGWRQNKQNVFDDFAAAAQFLSRSRYTRADKLAIYGRSNGGLLVGATMTQHPDLFRAVLCGVPLLDMVRYHLFGGGKTWIPEYGNPDEEKDFAWIYAYSPLQHLRANTKYPALLMLSADADDRVEPLHARKFVAEMQHLQGGAARDQRPVLLRVEKNSGHAGADLNRQLVEYWADAYSFLIQQLNSK